MGANVGSAISSFLFVFRVTALAPVLAFIGILVILVSKAKKKKEIGKIIGRDHASVLHACRQIEGSMDIKDKLTLEMYGKVKKLLITCRKM
jgi:hypothetical protein